MNVHPLCPERDPPFAGEVQDVDLRDPLGDEQIAQVEQVMDTYAVLVFRNQQISDAQQQAFSQRLGELERPGAASNITRAEDRRLQGPMADLGNLDKQACLLGRFDRQRMFNLGNRLWHSDSSYKPVPAKFSLLSARVLPRSGGDTEFADMRAAYAALDAAARAEIEDLVCEHSLIYSRQALGFDTMSDAEKANFEPVHQPLVRTHPTTGRRSLFLSAHAGTIVGWPVAEARTLLRDLNEHATRPERVYAHQWRLHDLVIWDNRQTMHRLRRFDDLHEIRDMRRTTVAGDGPVV